jgi:flagellar biosynthesis/type III secretory pathway chaperone
VESRAAVLEQVLALLCEEEQALASLLTLALDEQQALIESDFEEISAVSTRMQDAAEAIERIEANRLNLLRSVGAEALTLEELLPLADDLGVEGFADIRLQLGARAQEVRDAQEQNARLLLNAMKLRDRWANLLGGHLAMGYGSDGRRHTGDSRGTVSRSA